MKIAFITIATNKYVSFAQNLYQSLCKYKNNLNIEFICFTNSKNHEQFNTIPVTHIPFPIISLMRYHYYYSQYNLLNSYDYIFHIDCDMEIVDDLDDTFLSERTTVIHPSYFYPNINNNSFPYDRNSNSQAYIPYNAGKSYYQNCFQGGDAKLFLEMCDILQKKIEHDLRNNYIALWHDESYMNKYMLENPPQLELSPIYAQPEGWNSFGKTKILHKFKNNIEIRSI